MNPNPKSMQPVPNSPQSPEPMRRPPQYTLTGLFVVMVVFSLASAPAYYLIQGAKGAQGSHLIGMLLLLTGPMFLMVILSLLLSLLGFFNRR